MKPSPLVLGGLAALLSSCAASPCMAVTAEPALLLPWGDAVIALAQVITAFLVPLAITAATAALARIAGPLQALITTSLVERLVRNVGDYAINAVAGAVRGRTLSVPVGSAVIARAVQRALDQAPAWLLKAAGGAEGLADKVFRSLPLDEEATTGNTLPPALDALRAGRDRASPT
ncbi:hypothetical protein [Methylobacterium sp. Leaf93]|uniref:hypothetical protein n=1 Tax=Methylobacterium sp. Leaf93 TaxID=1736249 RepID=UPI0006FDED82|nr:hypothetical protein [Methylobacterium sp. Leaf93]KQP12994.1 hypothetical protein ASF26_19540 [Methylobacterium sp. Leaf93]